MSKLKQAKLGLTALFSLGILLHGTRLAFGVDFVQEHVLTRAFDSGFALLMLLVVVLLLRALRSVAWRGMGDRALYGFLLFYVTLSTVLHARSWLVADNTEMFEAFPYWYSAVFIVVILLILRLFWRLPAKEAA